LAISRILDYVDRAKEAEKEIFGMLTPPIERIGRKTSSVEYLRTLRSIAPSRAIGHLDSVFLKKVDGQSPPFATDVLDVLRDEESVRDLLLLLESTNVLIGWRSGVLSRVDASREAIQRTRTGTAKGIVSPAN
jgi:hypothetical protein